MSNVHRMMSRGDMALSSRSLESDVFNRGQCDRRISVETKVLASSQSKIRKFLMRFEENFSERLVVGEWNFNWKNLIFRDSEFYT